MVSLCLAGAGAPGVCAQTGLSQDELKLLEMLNHEREREGLPLFVWSRQLRDAARAHTEQLVEHAFLSHQFESEPDLIDRIGATGLRFDASGENIAFATTVEDLHRGLMNSPLHRGNILNPRYTAIGIAIVPRKGDLFLSEDFAHTLPALSEAQFRDEISAGFNKARTAHGLPPVAVIPDSRLREAACSEKADGRERIQDLRGVSNWVIFTITDAEVLPPDFLKPAADSTLLRVSVGVCFKPRKEHGYFSFRVVAAFFLVN